MKTTASIILASIISIVAIWAYDGVTFERSNIPAIPRHSLIFRTETPIPNHVASEFFESNREHFNHDNGVVSPYARVHTTNVEHTPLWFYIKHKFIYTILGIVIFIVIQRLINKNIEQDGAGQPATRSESK